MKKLLLIASTLSFSLISSLSFADCVVCAPAIPKNTTLKQAIHWYRDSAEKRASYRQVFNLGTNYVQHWVLQHHPKPKTWGVVLDVDETSLDNSWYYYRCEDPANDESTFEHFVTIPQKSVALPGVVNFTHLVQRLGGYVSLVTNRDGSYSDKTGNTLTATVVNLRRQNIAYDQIIFANYKKSKQPSNKNPRFQAIIHGAYDSHEMVWTNKLPPHQIIAYFGDNIQDFPLLKQSLLNSLPADAKAYDKFGYEYFILPNPIYGSWQTNQYH